MRTSLGAATLYFSAPGCSSKGLSNTCMRSLTCTCKGLSALERQMSFRRFLLQPRTF